MKIQTSRQFFARLAARRLFRQSRAFAPRYRVLSAALLLTGGLGLATVRADDTWTGTTSGVWSVGTNWTNGSPATAPYGTLFFSTTTNSPTTDDIATLSENALFFNASGTNPFVINGTGTISLFDNSGTQSKIENNNNSATSGLFTLNTSVINFAATAGAAWGEINAVTGDITFGASNTLNVNGSIVAGIKMFGAGHTTTFSNTVAAGTKYFATTGASAGTVAVSGAFTSGDFYLMNGSTLNVSSTGTNFNAAAVRLGGDFGTTLTQDLTKGATFNLTLLTGGQTFANVINSMANNTSGALVVNSQNTSGTNTLSGHLALDSSLAINETAGSTGTLAITQARAGGAGTTTGTDIKGFTLTLAAASGNNINVTGDIYNSTGSGNVTKTGVGTLTLTGANTYTGGTTIAASGGTVNLGTGGTTGTLSGTGAVSVGTSSTFVINHSNAMVQGTDFGTLTGAGAFTQSGSGITTLSATNTLTGNTTISAGILRLAGGAAIADTAAIANIASGGLLDLNGTSETVGSVTAAPGSISLGAGTLTLASNNASSMTGLIYGTGSGALVKQGTNTLTLGTLQNSGNSFASGNLFGGGLTISGGTVTINAANSSGTGLVSLNTGGVALNISQPQLLLSGGITINAGTATLSNTNAGGTGTVTLNTGGTLTITSAAATQLASVVLNGGTFTTPAQAVTFGSLSGAQGFTAGAFGLTFGTNNTSATYSGNIGGAVASNITKTGSGTQVLSGTNATSGTITVNGLGGTLEIGNQYVNSTNVAAQAGTLRLNFNTASGVTTDLIKSAPLSLSGGTLSVVGKSTATDVIQNFTGTTLTANTASTVSATNVTGGGNTAVNLLGFTRNAGSTVNFNLPSGTQSATNGILTTSGGTSGLFVTGTIAYAAVNGTDFAAKSTGNVVPLTGSVTATGGTSLTGTSADNADISTATVSTTAASSINTVRFNNAAGSTLTLGGALTVTGSGILVSSAVTSPGSKLTGFTLTSATDVIIQQFSAQPFTLNSAVVGTGVILTKAGPGTLILTANNSNSGVTYVNSGVLQIGAGGSLAGSVVTLAPNDPTAVFDVNNQTTAVSNIDGGGGTGGYINLGLSGTLNISGGNGSQFKGALVGGVDSAINKTGSGSQGFNGANNNAFYGTLTIASGNTIGSFSGSSSGFTNANVVNNGTYNVGNGPGVTISFGSLSGSGSIVGASNVASNQTYGIGNLNKDTTFSGVISNGTGTSGTGAPGTPGLTLINKIGSGTLTLSGNNTFTGTAQVNTGGIVFDYSGGKTPLTATTPLTVGGGTATFRGLATSPTAITTGAFGVNNNAFSRVVVDGNGGGGTALTLTTTTNTLLPTLASTSANNVLLFDLSSSASNVLQTSAVIGAAVAGDSATVAPTAIRTNNSLLTTGAGNGSTLTGYRSDVLIRTTAGYGFATNNGTTTISRYTGATALTGADTATVLSDNTNYKISNTSLTRANNFQFFYNTLELDSSTAAASLTTDPSGNRFGNGSQTTSGRGVLATGTFGATITGPGGTNQTTYFNNYLTGSTLAGQTFTLNMPLVGTTFYNGLATNLTVATGVVNASDQWFQSGVVRLTGAQVSGDALTAGSGVYRLTGGILEIGADLTGTLSATSGADFTRSVGNNAAGQVQLVGDTGFSAYTGTVNGVRTVNLGGAGQQLAWGVDNFMISTGGGDGNNTLRFSSAYADSTLEFQNPLALGSITRNVDVANGAATVDARLSGVISGVFAPTVTLANGAPAVLNAAAGLNKLGLGTLELSAVNTYNGPTTVNAGTLMISGRLVSTNTVKVNSGGTLLLSGAGNLDRINDAAGINLAGGTLARGSGASEGSGTAAGLGALTLTANSTIDFGTGAAGTLTFTTFTPGTFTLNILNFDDTQGQIAGTDGTDERLIFFGDQAANLGSFVFGSGAPGANEIALGGGFFEIVPVPEPATWLGGGLLVLGAAWSQRKRFRARRAA